MLIHKRLVTILLAAAVVVSLSLSALFVNAGDRVLSNNRGDGNSVWFITGEPTLIMNGFDLTPLGLGLPALIDRVTISVERPVPGAPIDVVIYQDGNGGSPVDAVLAGQTQVTINQAGVFTATFLTPVAITQPVVWVGFYLPADFRFFADTSGSSVLTYWAWTPGARFTLANLASASVFGPANGSAPVNINMQGIARITAEITGAATGAPAQATTVPVLTPGAVITPIVASTTTDLSVLKAYPPACDTLFKDTADLGITYRSSVDISCVAIWPGFAPPNPPGYVHKQMLYDLTFYNDRGVIADKLPLPVTHCIQPSPEDLNTAVVGIAYGSPRQWQILPTLRVGNLVCAEVNRGGNLGYFVPG